MGALLDNSPALDDEDLVGCQDGGKPVGDQDAGPGADQGIDGLLNRSFRNGIQGGGRLIKNEEGGVLYGK